MRADEILHPQYFTPADGLYPLFEPTGNDPLLLRGVVLQRDGHQHSAERLYAQAAKLHPDDAEAQVAAAVGRFDEDDLSASFSRLGPLVAPFPAEPVGALPPRPAARVDRAARSGDHRISARTLTRAEDFTRQGSKRVPGWSRDTWD